jgi:hypothetical protein
VFFWKAHRGTHEAGHVMYRGHIRMHISDSILPPPATCIQKVLQKVLLRDGSLDGQSGRHSEHLTSASFSPM